MKKIKRTMEVTVVVARVVIDGEEPKIESREIEVVDIDSIKHVLNPGEILLDYKEISKKKVEAFLSANVFYNMAAKKEV